MFASLLMLLIIVLMLVPGIYMGSQTYTLSPRSLIKILAFQTFLFMGIGLACKLFPWLIDPRVSLW